FLQLAALKRLVVDRYEDAAEGELARKADGRMYIARVTLRPSVRFGGERAPTAADLTALHHAAHEQCFIANSVLTEVRCEPRAPAV
ncbi:MAG TPA: OsmC family peroxiredoxin, partial [Fontimonas sp.]